jgi:hypothetical protein
MDVRMPDGTVITNVPDNVTQSEILARYNRMQGGAEPQASVQVSAPTEPIPQEYPQWASTGGAAAVGRPRLIDRTNVQAQPRPLESFAAGTIKGGVVDPILGTAQFATGGNLGTSNLAQQVGQEFAPYQQTNPTAFGGGQITGALAPSGLIYKGVQKGIGMLPSFERLAPTFGSLATNFPKSYQAGKAAVGGAATAPIIGATTPIETGETGQQFYEQKAERLPMDVALGAGGSFIGERLAAMVRPRIKPEVEQLVNKGVNLTPAQITGGYLKSFEDRMTSILIIGDVINYARTKGIEEFNKAAYKQVLEPIGAKVPDVTGREGVRLVKKEITNAYDEVLPKITFVRDADLETKLANVGSQIDGLTPDNATKVTNTVNKILNDYTVDGKIEGKTFKIVEEKLGKLAKQFGSSGNTDERLMGEAYQKAIGDIRESLARNNPQFAERLANINTAFSRYARIRAAGSMANTTEMFSPSQLASAVRKTDISSGKDKYATGTAIMQDLADAAEKVLPNKYPESGTAGRLLTPLAVGGAGGAAATGVLNPYVATALGVGTLPYFARGTTTSLMARRPEWAQQLADTIRSGSPFLGGASAKIQNTENQK